MQKPLVRMINSVHTILEEICPKPLSPAGIHGVLAAVSLSPRPSAPAIWMPVFFNMKNEQPEFVNREQAQTFLDTAVLAYNAVVGSFEGKEDAYEFPFSVPGKEADLLSDEEVGKLREWCEGFIKGLRCTGVEASGFDDDFINLMSPIAFCARPQVFTENQDTPEVAETFTRIAAEMPENIMALRDYFFLYLRQEQDRQNIAQNTGRNDPCPCGSGKKFKHCCGRKS